MGWTTGGNLEWTQVYHIGQLQNVSWTGEELCCLAHVVCQVSQDRRGFHLHFVHVPLDGGDLSNCIELLVQLDSDGKEGESLDETCAIATLLGRTTTSRSHHQLLFDGYLSALCSLI